MYKAAYSETIAESPDGNRHAERRVLLSSIELMERAEAAGPHSPEALEAIQFVSRLWLHFIDDLGRPDNALSRELRAKLISIGLFLIRSGDDIRAGRKDSFKPMIEITTTIAEGLSK